ncbi:hypothetical protein ACW2AB_07235 [Limosilactobacillus fermentum]
MIAESAHRRQAAHQAAPDASGDVTMTRQESLELAKKERREWPLRQLKQQLVMFGFGGPNRNYLFDSLFR